MSCNFITTQFKLNIKISTTWS